MDNSNLWKYFRYLMLAVLTASISISAISCDKNPLIGPTQPVDDEDTEEDPPHGTGD